MSDTQAKAIKNGSQGEPNVNLQVKARPSLDKEPVIDRSAQPDIINLRMLETSTNQEVESDVLRPVVFSANNTFCRFELEPKGFLSPGSTISFSVASPGDAVDGAHFPLNVGVHSLIERAVLKTSSGRVITDTEEFGQFSSYKSMFLNSSVQREREQYVSGRVMAYEQLYTDPTTADTEYESNTTSDNLGLSNGKEYGGKEVSVQATANADNGLIPRNCCVITDEASRSGLNPTFSIALHDLFPFLKAGNQLPLFMFGSDRIQVELTFTDPAKFNRMVLPKTQDGKAAAVQFLIDQNSVELLSDHIFYPGRMDEWANSNKNLTFKYFDYALSRQTITSAADDTDTSKVNVRQVGGAGRIVTRCFTSYKPNNTADPDLSLMNNYQATGMSKTADKVGKLESNLFYNERFLYPLNITNGARHFHNLRDAEMKQVYTNRQVYSGGGNILAGQYNGREITQLSISQFYQAWRLNRGERVGTKGIELTMNATDNAGTGQGLLTGVYTQCTYTEQLRYAELNNGHLEVYYS